MSILNQMLKPNTALQAELTTSDIIASTQSMSEAHNHVTQDIAEMTRLVDIAEGLDNVVGLAGYITEAKNTEVALVENSLNLALAGVDQSFVRQQTMGLESNIGTVIATEGIRDVAARIWEGIKDLMDRIRAATVKFFKTRWGAVASLRKTLMKLKARAEKTVGKAIDIDKTNLGREIKAIYSKEKLLSESELIAAVENIKETTEALFGDYAEKVNEAGGTIAKAMDDFDVKTTVANDALSSAHLAAISISTILGRFPGAPETGVTTENDSRVPSGTVARVHSLLFSQSMFTLHPVDPAGSTLRQKAENAAKSRIMFTSHKVKNQKKIEDGTIGTLSTAAIDTICNALLDALETIEQYEGSNTFKEVDKVKKDIHSKGDVVAKAVAGESDLEDGVSDASKGLRALSTGYARWSAEGFTSYTKHVLDVGNALAVISNKCLANYK